MESLIKIVFWRHTWQDAGRGQNNKETQKRISSLGPLFPIWCLESLMSGLISDIFDLNWGLNDHRWEIPEPRCECHLPDSAFCAFLHSRLTFAELTVKPVRGWDAEQVVVTLPALQATNSQLPQQEEKLFNKQGVAPTKGNASNQKQFADNFRST